MISLSSLHFSQSFANKNILIYIQHRKSDSTIIQRATAAVLVNMKLLHVVVLSALVACVLAQRGPGRGMGPGMGGEGMGGMGGMMHNGMGQGGMGGMMNGGMGCAMDGCPGPVFMSLLNQHTKIQREYKDTDSGIRSLTTSDDPEVAALIKTHVQQMNALLASCAKGQCNHTPRYFDPLFRAVYANADKIDMQVRVTSGGPIG